MCAGTFRWVGAPLTKVVDDPAVPATQILAVSTFWESCFVFCCCSIFQNQVCAEVSATAIDCQRGTLVVHHAMTDTNRNAPPKVHFRKPHLHKPWTSQKSHFLLVRMPEINFSLCITYPRWLATQEIGNQPLSQSQSVQSGLNTSQLLAAGIVSKFCIEQQ
jgi:hypothetical protein